ncbi:serum amyloid A-5 protein-like isoform X1 [Peromyscus maniculatus bairdii]|uniref:serum amyloid A-5 protein-like isoform X1 n=1 Tax=Peromyscus maniculatus bairdii TaxID=230844 RepID=UPI003FD30C80
MQDETGDCSTSRGTVYIDNPSHISSTSDTSHSPEVSAGTDRPGTRDMWRAYSDMREANWKYSDKYFRARGNYDAAQRGPGGAWAAKVISDAREDIRRFIGRGTEQSRANQFANEWGRSGLNPNYFRPLGLPSKY